MRRTLLLTLPLLLAAATDGRASKVKVWHQNKPANFDKARLSRVVVSNEGTLRLSRQLKPLVGLDATHVWDLLEDKNGNLYAATGDAGKIYKIGADGKATAVFTSDDGQVLCLALS